MEKIGEHFSGLRTLLGNMDEVTVSVGKAAALLSSTYEKQGTLFVCGNGGSATIAQHCVAEFVVRFAKDRRALPAIALGADIAVLTACANDYGYERVFERQVEALCNSQDLLLCMTTSGKSQNIIRAAQMAKQRNMCVISLVGKEARELELLSDVLVSVPSTDTSYIQSVHLMVCHLLCGMIDEIYA